MSPGSYRMEDSLSMKKIARITNSMLRNAMVKRFIFPVTGITALVYIAFMNSFEYVGQEKRHKCKHLIDLNSVGFSQVRIERDDKIIRVKKVEYAAVRRRSTVVIPENYTGIPCDYTLDLTKDEIIEKIRSYDFPGIEEYMEDLFQDTDERVIPRDPVFVTGLSYNHFKEGLAMIYNFNKMINADHRRELIVYDLGLWTEQVTEIEKECSCQVRSFPFDDFPEHVRILKGYSWKPLIIQLVAKRNPFVIWLDASIRFTTSNIDEMLQAARSYGVLAIGGVFRLAHQTSLETFRYLDEPPCLYGDLREVQTGVTMIYQTPFVKKYIMKPWVSCALVRGCMVPVEDVYTIQNCRGDRHYFHCHRFDQSILGILINRLFHRTFSNHYISLGKYFLICWNCKVKE